MDPQRSPTVANDDLYPALRDELVREYRDVASEEAIERVAHHAVGRFAEARLREFVPLLARRHALSHLRPLAH